MLGSGHSLMAAADGGERADAAGHPADEETAEETGEMISVSLSD